MMSLRPTRVLVRGFRTSASSWAAASPLETRIRDGLKSAMKSKDKPTSTCLKSVLADITNAAKASPNPTEPASESAVIKALRQGIAQRKEAALSYAPDSSSAHSENYDILNQEIDLLQSYLPTTPSAETISGVISGVFEGLTDAERSAKGAAGTVMKAVMDKLGDAAAAVDRKEIGKLVSEALKKR